MEFVVDSRFLFFYILAALFGAALFTFLLYRKDFFSKELSPRSPRYFLLIALRYISVFMIVLILPGLVYKSSVKKTEDPIVVFALDNSTSIISNKDSAEIKSKFLAQWQNLNNEAKKNFETKNFTFGDKVNNVELFKGEFTANESDLSELFESLAAKYENRNVGAVVIASDGIYNRGEYPSYSAKQFNVPVYAIGLGDTAIYKDIAIQTVKHNKIVFTKNAFQVQVDLQAFRAKGNQIRITAIRGGKVLGNEVVPINMDKQVQSVTFTLEADEPGVQSITFNAEILAGEKNTSNNSYTIYYEVLDNKNKTLILAESPHPDVAALKRAIEANEGNEVQIAYSMSAPAVASLKDYAAVVYHGLPSNSFGIDEYQKYCKENSISQGFILTSSTAINRFNNCTTGLQITNSRYGVNESTPLLQNDFSFFSLEQNTMDHIADFPPISCPYGTYTVNSSYGRSMLTQKIGNVNTQNPLIFVNNDPTGKYVVICGEGLYKWGTYDQLKWNNKEISNNIFQSLMQFLSAKKDTRKFRVYSDKNIYRRNENILFTGEVYDENNKPVENATITMRIHNERKEARNFTFSKVGDRYELNAGSFEPGDYKWSTEGSFGTKKETLHGSFSVQKTNPELINTRADFSLLRDIASKTNGKFFTQDQTNEVLKDLNANKRLSRISYFENSYQNMIDLKWLFVVLVTCMCVEWGLRKYFGNI